MTLPEMLLREIDAADDNRSGFLARAAARELARLRRLALRKCLDASAPAEERLELAEAGLAEAVELLPAEDVSHMVALDGGTPIHWTPGVGWRART